MKKWSSFLCCLLVFVNGCAGHQTRHRTVTICSTSRAKEICFSPAEYTVIRQAQIRRKAKIEELKRKHEHEKKALSIRYTGQIDILKNRLKQSREETSVALKSKGLAFIVPGLIGFGIGVTLVSMIALTITISK